MPARVKPRSRSVAANDTAVARSGAIVVNGARVTVNQEPAPCRFDLDRSSAQIAAEGGRVQVAISAVAGVQYTFHAGINVVLEYHRNGRGLDDAEWAATLRGSRAPGPSPGRQQFVFMRAARSVPNAVLAPEFIMISGLDDGSLTLVPGLTWMPAGRMHIHARVTRLVGGPRSVAGLAPWSTSLTAGATVRF